MNTTYVVWRRSDGFVAATTYKPRPANDFDILLVTASWAEAKELIETERALVSNLLREGE